MTEYAVEVEMEALEVPMLVSSWPRMVSIGLYGNMYTTKNMSNRYFKRFHKGRNTGIHIAQPKGAFEDSPIFLSSVRHVEHTCRDEAPVSWENPTATSYVSHWPHCCNIESNEIYNHWGKWWFLPTTAYGPSMLISPVSWAVMDVACVDVSPELFWNKNSCLCIQDDVATTWTHNRSVCLREKSGCGFKSMKVIMGL